MKDSPSEPLAERLRSGDETALGELFDRHAALVNGLALRILRNPTDAEDVVQEVFVQAWRQRERFDVGRGSLQAWLCTMARTRALDRLRRVAARREEPEDAAPSPSAPPSTLDQMTVRKALDVLSDGQRRAIELAYYEGLTQTEIAERLQEPLGTVKTRIRTGLLRLRESLG